MRIEEVVTDYKEVLPEANIYVYDNNSADGTDEIAKRAGAIVKYEYHQGMGNVIRTMFRDIDADCYIMIDEDDTYPAECARQMVELILNKGADMVIGDRLSSTLVPRFPTLFVSICLMNLAALSLVCGLILDTVAKSNRKDFEIKFNSYVA